MSANFSIRQADASDAAIVARLVGDLLSEIMNAIGQKVFSFSMEETVTRLTEFIGDERYFVFLARCENGNPAGFIALYESYALYAEGAFGTIPELYVSPRYRSQNLGFQLIAAAKEFGASRRWTRLEVTTPPLPQFDRSLAFYEREGFSITGGRKLKMTL